MIRNGSRLVMLAALSAFACSHDRETMTPELNRDTFETNVPGVFLAGGAICGRDTSNIFIENGRFHGETIIKTIAERLGKRAAVSR